MGCRDGLVEPAQRQDCSRVAFKADGLLAAEFNPLIGFLKRLFGFVFGRIEYRMGLPTGFLLFSGCFGSDSRILGINLPDSLIAVLPGCLEMLVVGFSRPQLGLGEFVFQLTAIDRVLFVQIVIAGVVFLLGCETLGFRLSGNFRFSLGALVGQLLQFKHQFQDVPG
jgi:hypothetical protein